PLGYVVYKRSYARDLPSGSTEEWWQTCQRVVEGVFELQRRWIEYLNTRWDTARAQRSAQEMYRLMWDFKFLPPGRGLFSMGAPLLMEDGNGAPLFNCSFVSTEDINHDFAEPFCFCFSASAHGIGVGFDTAGANKVTIVEPRMVPENIFTIADSREGWVEALRVVLNAFIGFGSIPTFDYSKIRPFGAKIKRFGGTASGPEALKVLLETDLPAILTSGKITSTQIVDVMNVIGKCVVAGGARRSAELALGDAGDEDFISLKTDFEKLKAYRWASNNSLIIPERNNDFRKYVKPIMLNGEPGFFFIDNARRYGRMKRVPDNKDIKVRGLNPCGEITLESYELCNIAEVFISRCETFEDFKLALKYGYLYTKTVTLTKTPWPRTNEIMLRNRRIGLSLTGIIENINKLGFAQHIDWCEKGYDYIQELDKKYSDWLCIPRSIKTTTVKPSGSVSLLPGVTPGVHYPHSEFYIRNVRITRGSPLITILERSGYPIADDVYEKSSIVVSFPVKEKYYSRGKDEVSLWEQLENAAQMQEHWSDNSVSITVTVKPEEANQISEALDRYQSRLKTVSFLPLMDHSYEQAPYIKIDEKTYEEMVAKLLPLDLTSAVHEITEKYCDGDTCTL
ncbi:MAG: fused protease/ribonucleoside-triphosphate reductase, partial [Candidatus Pacearchaeota archaeon]